MLILPIKKKWYDMILSGIKKEEYREIKPYYQKRFETVWQTPLTDNLPDKEIMFRNGYSSSSPSFIAVCGISQGIGKTEWGAEEGRAYYILKIKNIKEIKNEEGKKQI